MNKLKEQIEYAKFFHTNQVSLDLKYAEELLEHLKTINNLLKETKILTKILKEVFENE